MKKKYISLMAGALSAYTDEHIYSYYVKVRDEGLTEHGFPRLTANLGILIAHGIRTDLTQLFCDMMDTCCQQIPRGGAANEFSVREILLCIAELDTYSTLPADTLDGWRAQLAAIDPYVCYDKVATAPTDVINNWACFTAASEYIRQYAGLCDSREFIDTQLATQICRLDENGMYLDPHEPMVYDLVPRGLFALLLHLGYDGRYRAEIDVCLRQAGLHTLKMQSVTGELAYGGRSNQFLFNEALMAIVFEYEANRYAREGDMVMAGKFKAATAAALDATERYLALDPIHHVKNRFPLASRYGCEKYAYFDKYMITAASYLYSAYLICDDSIPAVRCADNCAWETSHHFHKIFLRHGDYSLELDTCADTRYDISGLGRVHRKGAPSPICLAVPCTATPRYNIDVEHSNKLSLCPALFQDGQWWLGTSVKTQYETRRLDCDNSSARAQLVCTFEGGGQVEHSYSVSSKGVDITVSGDGKIGYILPAFLFDGETKTVITATDNTLQISYLGWVCRYTSSATICKLDRPARNRNGYYDSYFTESEGEIKISIEISKA